MELPHLGVQLFILGNYLLQLCPDLCTNYFRYVNYWNGVVRDYREALKELGQSCKEKPMKAFLLGSTSVAIW